MGQHSILKNRELNLRLVRKGYVVLPFLAPDEVEALIDIYRRYHKNVTIDGLYVSSKGKTWDELLEVSDAITAVISPRIDFYFQHIKKIGGAFIVKAPGIDGILHPHQDWSIVDESKYRSYAIWVALQDTNEDNGGIYVLPGSHEWVRGYRHVTIPSVYGQIYSLVWEYMVPVPLKAGEAIVFDHALAHASTPNNSDNPRIASVSTVISENAAFRICCNNDGVVAEYECPSDFYVKPEAQHAYFNLPKIKDTDFRMVQLNEKEFLHFARKEGVILRNRPQSLLASLKRWFVK